MRKAILVLAAATIGAAVASSAEARMSKQEVKAKLEGMYPVRVLEKYIEETEFEGREAYTVKVMNTGGDANSAFMVTTLVVDANTGEPLSVFRHKESGYVLSGADDRVPNRQPADTARSGHVWR